MATTGTTFEQAVINYLPILQVIAQYAPPLVNEIVGLLHSTAGNPTAADWQALSAKVAATSFDAPPSV